MPAMSRTGILLSLLAALVLPGLAAETTQEPAVVGVPAAAAEKPLPGSKRIAYIPIDSEIDELRARYFQRVVREAIEAKVDAVVVHLHTDGGTVDGGRKMLRTVLDVPKNAPPMVAFVDRDCLSAGAMIAYGHDRIYLLKQAIIGDIGVIFQGEGGKIEYAPEKIQTYVRELLRSAAQRNGWNEAKIIKMTAHGQELYQFNLEDGQHFVIEDELGRWLSEHPHIDPESKILVAGKDRLITYTGVQAVKEGMATGVVDGIDDVYRELGGSAANVLDLGPTNVEEVSWYLATWAPLLAAAAVLFIVLELKTPGVGLWATLAAIAGGAFFICQYYQDLAGNIELIMVLLGVAAVVAEIFFLPTGGFIGLAGFLLCVTGLVLAFMPDELQFNPDVAGFGPALGGALADSALAIGVVTIGIAWFIHYLPRSRLMNALAANAEISTTSAGTLESNAATLIGKRGVARTDLRPSGFVLIDGQEISAVSEHAEHLLPGCAVEIIALRYGEAIVRAVGTGAAA
jgi:membrane-bound serine protease (ClpP class)